MATLCPKAIVGNDISMHITPQADCGVIDPNPVFEEFQRTSGKSEKTPSYTESSAIKTNRQGRQQIRDGVEFAYTLETELSIQTIKYFLGGLSADILPEVDIDGATTISFDSVDNSINDSAGGFTDVQAGSWMFVDGEPYYIESVVDSTKVIVTSAQPLTDVAAGNPTDVNVRTARSSTNDALYTVQKRIKDTSQPGGIAYITQTDAVINAFNMTLPPRGIVTGSFGFTAADQIDGFSEVSGQSDVTVTPEMKEVMGAVDAINNIWIDFSKENVGMTEFSLDVDNSLTTQPQAGNEGPGSISLGTIVATGTLNSIALENNPLSEISKYEDGVDFAASIPFKFPNGDMMIVTMRNMKYTENTQNDGGDEIVVSSGTYAAQEDEFGTTVQIDIFTA